MGSEGSPFGHAGGGGAETMGGKGSGSGNGTGNGNGAANKDGGKRAGGGDEKTTESASFTGFCERHASKRDNKRREGFARRVMALFRDHRREDSFRDNEDPNNPNSATEPRLGTTRAERRAKGLRVVVIGACRS